MIGIQNISYFIGSRCLFSDVTFNINRGDRIGLVGPNGAGKTTLLNIIAGYIKPESGQINLPKGATIGYLRQETLETNVHLSVREFAMLAFAEVNQIEQELNRLGDRIMEITDFTSDEYQNILDKMTELQSRLDVLEGDKAEAKAEEVLEGLGFKTADLGRPLTEFSGGWRMRAALAKILLQNPDLLLLDEPTNHLDIDSIEWMEKYLQNYQGGVMLVSHDQWFLNRIVNQIADVRNKRIMTYSGNFDKYMEQREEQVEMQQKQFDSQQRQIAQTERFIERFRAKATKARQVQSRVKQLEKIERIEAPDDAVDSISFKFPDPPHAGQIIMRIQHLVKSYPNPKGGIVEVFTDGQDLEIRRGDKVAMIGPNGAGKSTLACIVDGIEPFEGKREEGHGVKMTFFAQHLADVMMSDLTILEEMEGAAKTTEARSRIRSLLGCFLFSGDDVFKPIKVLSGGERSRVALAKTLLSPANLLILDEPTNHLDMVSKEVLLNALSEYKGTIVAVSHDRHFLSGFANRIWRVEGGKVRDFEGGYEYYQWKTRQEMDILNPETKSPKQAKSEVKELPKSNGAAKNVDATDKQKQAKQLQRKLEQIEKTLADLENEKARMEQKMAQPEFYLMEDVSEQTKRFESLSKSIETTMEEWTKLGEELEMLN